MTAMRRATIAVAAAVLLSGCGGKSDTGTETLSADDYYAAMDVGDYANYSEEDLDRIGKSFCADLANVTPQQRRQSVLLLRESTDNEQQAFDVGQAMTGRWCPEYRSSFDY